MHASNLADLGHRKNRQVTKIRKKITREATNNMRRDSGGLGRNTLEKGVGDP